jgi:anti-sigma28 factor (negative regulator of flagellin synthesis)
MTVDEEIQLLEDHQKFMQDQSGIIGKKIAALKGAKEP